MKKQISTLQTVLTVISVVAILLSNIVVNKQIQLPFGITVSGGLFVFPISYILSDLFSEVYGYKWSRFTCYLTFALNLFMVLVFTLVLKAPSATYFENQVAFELVLGNTPRILIASLSAFVLGDWVNDKVFQQMQNKHKGIEGFTKRAFISSVCGGLVDTSIFGILAFAGVLSIKDIIIINVAETVLKLIYELMVLPLTKKLTIMTLNYEKRA